MLVVRTERPLRVEAIVTGDFTAVPVTFEEELGALIAGLEAEASTVGTLRTRGYSGQKAGELLERTGVARALGHATVPLTADEVCALGHVLESLELFMRNDARTVDLRTLFALLRMRVGMARVRCWRVAYGLAGLQWQVQPDGCKPWGLA